jgi:PAT family beta-lactamase induction signal transducer AmpG
MALGMLAGMVATVVIPEPEKNREKRGTVPAGYYLRFLALFVLAVSGFVLTFFLSSKGVVPLKNVMAGLVHSTHVTGFIVETLRFVLAVFVSFGIAELAIMMGFIPREMVWETYVEPVSNFFERYGVKLALLLLALIGLYRISDSVMGIMTNVFYQDMGFTKTEIATISKTFGLGMTIFGGFVGGILTLRFGIIRIMFIAAFFSSASCLLFMALANMGHSLPMLYVAISSDNLAGGVASAAFIAFLSSLTDIKFTAMQYAIFSSLMTLVPRIIGGYAGTMVDSLGYSVFFLITALLGIPVLVLVWLSGKYLLPEGEQKEKS